MDLAHLRKAIRLNPVGDSDKSGPQPSMDKSDLAPDQATHEDIVAVTDGSGHREDLVTFRMRPPATPNWLSSDELSKRWDRPLRGFEYDTVLTNEGKRLA